MNKYGARPTVVDGIRFASMAEARRYGELRLLERAGAIRDLRLQPSYDLVVHGERVARYIADFAYVDAETGAEVVEDVKGGKATATPVYRLKRKLLRACHGIEVVEVAT